MEWGHRDAGGLELRGRECPRVATHLIARADSRLIHLRDGATTPSALVEENLTSVFGCTDLHEGLDVPNQLRVSGTLRQFKPVHRVRYGEDFSVHEAAD